FAIQVGILLAAFLFLNKIANDAKVETVKRTLGDDDEEHQVRDMSGVEIPRGIEVFELYGSLFFGAVGQFKESLRVV
ncbi:hypothetical protein, partial [Vibrio parahaemolyticus]|uniref:hypothetical protein n=1 Tax=Vibrio parahaemolyticus TaxID=670 RepID=UPI001A8C8C59